MAFSAFSAGKTALITGSASGIGYAFATLLRQRGMNLILLDNNAKYLEAATGSLRSHPAASSHPEARVTAHVLDVSDLNGWNDLKPKILSEHPRIDVLLLNAGTAFKPTTSQSYEDIDYFTRTFGTNVYGVLNGLATFLPVVQKSAQENKESRTTVIITGSKQGITNPPGNPAYNMSKAALKLLTEHLAHDLRTPDSPSFSPNTSVHLLIPGWTYTGQGPDIGSEERKPKGAWLPAQVADFALQQIESEQFYILCPDNEVDVPLDQARMQWATGDIVEARGVALSRWDNRFKDEAAKCISEEAEKRRKKE